MQNYLWLFAIAGGALILGMALSEPCSGALHQRRNETRSSKQKSFIKNNRTDTAIGLFGKEQKMARKRELYAILGALIFMAAAAGVHLYTSLASETAPSVSVTGKEAPNQQPAGPADEEALPGDQ